ncbi:MAG: acyltransferase [Candidatus Obscuribacterales bacterium]
MSSSCAPEFGGGWNFYTLVMSSRVNSNSKESRIKQLDVLRGIAILLVLGHHSFSIPASILQIPLAGFLIGTYQSVGWAGVDLFFVLSGFLVSGLVFTEFKQSLSFDLKRFLIRRGFKIYPAYYFFSVVGWITIPWILIDLRNYWRPILCELCFVQNYGSSIWAHTWSMAVEEHFYFLCGCLLLFLSRQKYAFTVIPKIGLVLGIGACAWRFATCLNGAWNYHYLYYTHLRLDSLFAGVVLSYLYHCQRAWLDRIASGRVKLMLVASAILVSPCAFFGIRGLWTFSVGLTCLYLGFTLLLLSSLYGSIPPKGFAIGILSWIGYFSYSIYLWHQPVFAVVGILAIFIHDPIVRFCTQTALYVSLSFLTGFLMARWIERPFLKLRDRIYPSRSPKLRMELHENKGILDECST